MRDYGRNHHQSAYSRSCLLFFILTKQMGHVFHSSSNVGMESLKQTRRMFVIQQGSTPSTNSRHSDSHVIMQQVCSTYFWNSWSHRKMLSLILKFISGSNTMLGPLSHHPSVAAWRRCTAKVWPRSYIPFQTDIFMGLAQAFRLRFWSVNLIIRVLMSSQIWRCDC